MEETWTNAQSLQHALGDFSQEKEIEEIAADNIDDGKPIILIAEDKPELSGEASRSDGFAI